MDSSADAALMNTTWSFWYWFGGFFGDFIIPMAVGYILLWFTGWPKRRASTAIALRVLTVLVTAFLVYANYLGSGGQLNPGGLLALVVIFAWAVMQQMTRKSA